MRPKDKEIAEEIARRVANEKIESHEENSLAHNPWSFVALIFWTIFIIVIALWAYHTTFVTPYLNYPAVNDSCKILQEKINGTSSNWRYISHDVCTVCWQDCVAIDGKLACDELNKNCRDFVIS